MAVTFKPWHLVLIGAVVGALVAALVVLIVVDDGTGSTANPSTTIAEQPTDTPAAGAEDSSTVEVAPSSTPSPSVPTCRSDDTPSSEASSAVGRRVTVCGGVSGASYQSGVNGKPTFINFDKPFPNHTFTVVIWGDNRGNFSPPPEQQFGGGTCVRVTGLVETFQGDPQIVVTSPSQISLC